MIFLTVIRRSSLVAVTTALAVFGCFILSNGLNPVYASHGDNVDVLHDTTAMVMPVFAGFLAWNSKSSFHASGARDILSSSARSRTMIFLLHLVKSGAFAILLWGIMLLFTLLRPLVVFGTFPNGPLLYPQLLASLVLFLVFTVIAVVIGFVIGGWLGSLIAAIPPLACYGIALFLGGNDPLMGLIPYGDRSSIFFLDTVPEFFLIQAVTYAGCGLLVASQYMLADPGKLVVKSLATLASIGLVVGGAQLMQEQGGVWGVDKTDIASELKAFRGERVTIWADPDIAPAQEELLRVWDRVAYIVSDTEQRFTEVKQLQPYLEPSERLVIFHEGVHRDDYVYQSVIQSFYDVQLAYCKEEKNPPDILLPAWLAGQPVEKLYGTQLEPASEKAYRDMLDMDLEQSRDWFTAHYEDFKACNLLLLEP